MDLDNLNFNELENIVIDLFDKDKLDDKEIKLLLSSLSLLADKYNSSNACYSLGKLYFKGELVNKNFTLAKQYFIRSVKKDIFDGAIELSKICLTDEYKDYELAFKILNKAILQDENRYLKHEATLLLSDMYFNGYFVSKDIVFAINLLKSIEDYENFISINDDLCVVSNLFLRLARCYDVTKNDDLYWKYLALSKASLISQGNNKFEDYNSLLKEVYERIEQYKLVNKENYFSYSINNPKTNDINEIIKSLNDNHRLGILDSVIKSDINNDVILRFMFCDKYIALPEIGYADRTYFAYVVVSDATFQIIEPLNENGDIKLEYSNDELLIKNVIGDTYVKILLSKYSSMRFAVLLGFDQKNKETSALYLDEYSYLIKNIIINA